MTGKTWIFRKKRSCLACTSMRKISQKARPNSVIGKATAFIVTSLALEPHAKKCVWKHTRISEHQVSPEVAERKMRDWGKLSLSRLTE